MTSNLGLISHESLYRVENTPFGERVHYASELLNSQEADLAQRECQYFINKERLSLVLKGAALAVGAVVAAVVAVHFSLFSSFVALEMLFEGEMMFEAVAVIAGQIALFAYAGHKLPSLVNKVLDQLKWHSDSILFYQKQIKNIKG